MMNWICGMDVSSLLEVEACGGRFSDGGKPGDALEILRNNGSNLVRLRLWNDPYTPEGQSYGAGTCDLPCVMILARRARDLGMDWMLDFQYSDFWTDPGKQLPPKSWVGKTVPELEQAVFDYTLSVLTVLREARLTPSIVSVGNELSNGLLWPEGQYPNFDRIARFLGAGIRAVRQIDPSIPTMIHLDNGCRNSLFRDWLDQYFAAGGPDFEYLGMSYYPVWHGAMEDLRDNLNDLAVRYGKDMIVTETSACFTLEDYQRYERMPAGLRVGPTANAATMEAMHNRYPTTPEGQCQFLTELTETLRQVPGGHGKGFVWWEPAWIPVPGSEWANAFGRAYIRETSKGGGNEWANQALFDYDGNALPALHRMKTL